MSEAITVKHFFHLLIEVSSWAGYTFCFLFFYINPSYPYNIYTYKIRLRLRARKTKRARPGTSSKMAQIHIFPNSCKHHHYGRTMNVTYVTCSYRFLDWHANEPNFGVADAELVHFVTSKCGKCEVRILQKNPNSSSQTIFNDRNSLGIENGRRKELI